MRDAFPWMLLRSSGLVWGADWLIYVFSCAARDGTDTAFKT